MHRIAFCAALAAALLAGCQKGGSKKGGGPAVAEGDGVRITADEFKARLDEQSPFVRARYQALDKKKELLDNLVRFEVLANEARRQGFDKDADVELMMKRVMVQKMLQKNFQDDPKGGGPAPAPDADVQAYYDAHKDEFHRPAKVRVSQILVRAPASGPERAKAEDEAKKILARVRAEEKKAPGAFATIAREASQDETTKAAAGDLGFRAREELASQLSPAAADAAFALSDGGTSDVLAVPQGFAIVKRTGFQDALDRPLDAVKSQIATRLSREKRQKDLEELVKRLKDQAKVKVDEKELEKIQVAAAPGGGAPAGMMGGMGSPHGGAPAPGPAAPQGAPPAARP